MFCQVEGVSEDGIAKNIEPMSVKDEVSDNFFDLSWTFHSSDTSEDYRSLICGMFLMIAFKLWIFGTDTTEIMMYSSCILGWHTVLICVITDDTHFDHLIKMVSVRLL